jgi:phosphoserine phosphatase RsbU/P
MQLDDRKKYQLLFEISQKVRDTLDLDEIMNHLLDTVRTVVDYDAAGIFVLNQDIVHGRNVHPTEVIAGIARRGFDERPSEKDAMLTLGKGIIGHVIFSATSLIVPDVTLEPRYVEGRELTRSEIAVPILRGERAIGALNLESDRAAAYGPDDLEVLQFFADAAAISIEKAMLHRQLVDKELVDKQLELARDLQWRLFPSLPPRLPGYDIAGVCLPAEQIGGDYYDFIPLEGSNVGLAVADVSGNGIAAALFMSAFRGLLRTHACSSCKPAHTMRKINRQLPNFTSASHFVSAVYATLDPLAGEFTYVSCGHPPPLLVHSDGSWERLAVHGPVLGIFQAPAYPTDVRQLEPGDIVVLYTDGVVELTNPEEQEFGIERLAEALRYERHLAANELIQQVFRHTREFSGSQSYVDDFTLVVAKRLPG